MGTKPTACHALQVSFQGVAGKTAASMAPVTCQKASVQVPLATCQVRNGQWRPRTQLAHNFPWNSDSHSIMKALG